MYSFAARRLPRIRARRGALSILMQLAQKTRVLVFTHHRPLIGAQASRSAGISTVLLDRRLRVERDA